MYVFDKTKPIAIGCDHAGFDCKEDLDFFPGRRRDGIQGLRNIQQRFWLIILILHTR